MRLTFDRVHVATLLVEAQAAESSHRYSPFTHRRGHEPELWMIGGEGVFIVNNLRPYQSAAVADVPSNAIAYAREASPYFFDLDGMRRCKYYSWGPDDGVHVFSEESVTGWLGAGTSGQVTALVHPFQVLPLRDGWRPHSREELAQLLYQAKVEYLQMAYGARLGLASEAEGAQDLMIDMDVKAELLHEDLEAAAVAHALSGIDHVTFQDRLWRRYLMAADEFRDCLFDSQQIKARHAIFESEDDEDWE